MFVVPRFGKSRLAGTSDKALDPTTMMAMTIAGNHTDDETIANIKADRGLDKPLVTQYFLFVRDALTNNLKSYRNGDLVIGAIARRFPATLWLAATGLILWLLIAIPLGTLTAKYDRSVFDRLSLILGVLALSIPTFWLGKLLQYYVGYRWAWFSVGGEASWYALPLPALTLALGGAAYYSRLLHANMRGVLKQEYIRAAARARLERDASTCQARFEKRADSTNYDFGFGHCEFVERLDFYREDFRLARHRQFGGGFDCQSGRADDYGHSFVRGADGCHCEYRGRFGVSRDRSARAIGLRIPPVKTGVCETKPACAG